MSLKTVHQVIIFAGIAISLIFSAFCFLDPIASANWWFDLAGVGCVFAAIGLIGYEIHFLKKTRKLVL